MRINDIIQKAGLDLIPSKDEAIAIINNLREDINKYIADNNHIQAFVLHVDGTMDSTIVAVLLQEKYTNIPLIGVNLPIQTPEEQRNRAKNIGKAYCSSFHENGIFFNSWRELYEYMTLASNTPIYKAFDAKGKTPVGLFDKFQKTDLNRRMEYRSRLRMLALYDLASKVDGLVVSSMNYSDYMAGFFTIHGNVGDIYPIRKLRKGFDLPVIALELGIDKEVITATKNDELDMDYKTFEAILYFYENEMLPEEFSDLTTDAIVRKAIQVHEFTEYKRKMIM